MFDTGVHRAGMLLGLGLQVPMLIYSSRRSSKRRNRRQPASEQEASLSAGVGVQVLREQGGGEEAAARGDMAVEVVRRKGAADAPCLMAQGRTLGILALALARLMPTAAKLTRTRAGRTGLKPRRTVAVRKRGARRRKRRRSA